MLKVARRFHQLFHRFTHIGFGFTCNLNPDYATLHLMMGRALHVFHVSYACFFLVIMHAPQDDIDFDIRQAHLVLSFSSDVPFSSRLLQVEELTQSACLFHRVRSIYLFPRFARNVLSGGDDFLLDSITAVPADQYQATSSFVFFYLYIADPQALVKRLQRDEELIKQLKHIVKARLKDSV